MKKQKSNKGKGSFDTEDIKKIRHNHLPNTKYKNICYFSTMNISD